MLEDVSLLRLCTYMMISAAFVSSSLIFSLKEDREMLSLEEHSESDKDVVE